MDPLLKKLQYRSPATVTVLDPPPEVEPLIEAWTAEAEVRCRIGERESFVLAFVRSGREVAERAAQLAGVLADDPLLWFAYPKKSSKRYTSDLAQMAGWQPLGDLGFEAVRQVAVDADWSAVRFRRAEDIARLARRPGGAMSEAGRRRVGGVGSEAQG